eukprot:2844793-Rhodomonas_salina.2
MSLMRPYFSSLASPVTYSHSALSASLAAAPVHSSAMVCIRNSSTATSSPPERPAASSFSLVCLWRYTMEAFQPSKSRYVRSCVFHGCRAASSFAPSWAAGVDSISAFGSPSCTWTAGAVSASTCVAWTSGTKSTFVFVAVSLDNPLPMHVNRTMRGVSAAFCSTVTLVPGYLIPSATVPQNLPCSKRALFPYC